MPGGLAVAGGLAASGGVAAAGGVAVAGGMAPLVGVAPGVGVLAVGVATPGGGVVLGEAATPGGVAAPGGAALGGVPESVCLAVPGANCLPFAGRLLRDVGSFVAVDLPATRVSAAFPRERRLLLPGCIDVTPEVPGCIVGAPGFADRGVGGIGRVAGSDRPADADGPDGAVG